MVNLVLPNLIKSYNDWTHAVDEGWKVDILYLDYCKAFDLVPHMHLSRKLKSYGLAGKILIWLRSILLHRKQEVIYISV